MQVQPNSTIYLLAGVPIDKGYNYSLYFNDRASQTAYMQTMRLSNGSFTGQQYTRVEKGRLRVQVCADDVINCNYIMFKNNGTVTGGTRYADKWFYAFAHVQYVNEQCCDVIFEIDDIQTWMFDYEFNECFVEREHSATDVAGDNLQPEPVDTGELVAQDSQYYTLGNYMLGAIILSAEMRDFDGNISFSGIGSSWNITNDPSNSKNIVFTPNDPWETPALGADTSTGVTNGLYIYTGFLVNENDWTNYFSSHISSYYMPYAEDHGVVLTLGKLIQAITENKMSGLSESNIVACYQYPADFHKKTYVDKALTDGYKVGTFESVFGHYKPTNFKYGLTSSNYYTPKNKKLLTSPYVKMLLTSETGATGEYKFEFFKYPTDTYYCPLVCVGTYFCQPNALCMPTYYKGKEKDYDSALVTSPYPVPIYKGDALTQWMQSHKNTFILAGVSSVIAGLGGLFTSNNTATQSGAVGLGGSIATYKDKQNTPPNTYYQAQNEIINIQTNRTGFYIYDLAVTPEYARKIDSFFTKYGYAVNEVKVPNLQRGSTKRQNWNYLKVKNCMLHGILPSDVEDHLERIYEKGITFWNYNVTVGDYSIANPIVTPSTP